jgi:hypothetical protein
MAVLAVLSIGSLLSNGSKSPPARRILMLLSNFGLPAIVAIPVVDNSAVSRVPKKNIKKVIPIGFLKPLFFD